MSQLGQDFLAYKFLISLNNLSKTYVDIGAHDGISYSNTYFFEKFLGWKGICIEPNPNVFTELKKNRNSLNFQCAISDKNEDIEFMIIQGYSEMLSGAVKHLNKKHKNRIKSEVNKYNQDVTIVSVKSLKLQDILEDAELDKIDLLSIDIEGGEYSALKSIDFNRVEFRLIITENNYREKKIRKLLKKCNYHLALRVESDEFYCKNYDVKNIQNIAKKYFRKKNLISKSIRPLHFLTKLTKK